MEKEIPLALVRLEFKWKLARLAITDPTPLVVRQRHVTSSLDARCADNCSMVTLYLACESESSFGAGLLVLTLDAAQLGVVSALGASVCVETVALHEDDGLSRRGKDVR